MNKYILKKGVFLRQIGLLPLCESTLRNNDKLAEDYLKNDPTLIRYFASAPSVPAATISVPPLVSTKAQEVEIIEPERTEEPTVEVIPKVKKTYKRAKTKK